MDPSSNPDVPHQHLSPENTMKTLADAFEHTLQDVYYAENAIVKALPKVIDAVSNADLKTALKDHLGETKGQIKTLRAVFKSIGRKASGERCDAIEGLIKETQGVIEDSNGSVAKHAAIIGCCQAVEHYEFRGTARCANGPRHLARPKRTNCYRRSWIRKKRPTTNSPISPSPR
jgi:Domain of unknown function (DUF892)